MDKNSVKRFAVLARRELISRVSQRAAIYGITEEKIVELSDTNMKGELINQREKSLLKSLISEIQHKGYEEVMEEVAYTWFNRFSALRFMEVNGYLPSHIRVFTDDDNSFRPQILSEALHLEFTGIDIDKVYSLKNSNSDDELFKYLIILQCNDLSDILPGMFQKIEDYTELLFPENLLREGSVVEQMIASIPEEDWKDQVQIIGWLYQYYNSEKKDDVFAALKNNVKISKENVPAATQLFTPDWIVRYMVENSLGRLWLEGHPSEELQREWKYFLDEAEQEDDIKTTLEDIRKDYLKINPEDIKCIDPCSGSGHILAYMFDILMQIYEASGYSSRDAAQSIVKNNIFGLDIDDRAAQLAYFSVMMKGRQYDNRFFRRGVQPNVFPIAESNYVDSYVLEYICINDDLKNAMNSVIQELKDAKEYGSILSITSVNWELLYQRFDQIKEDISIYKEQALSLIPMVKAAENLARKYDVVITNPPYMGGTGMSPKLDAFIKKNYDRAKTDLYSVFIEKCSEMVKPNRFYAMITQHGWMFLSSFEKMRVNALLNNITSLVHLGARAFDEIGGEVVQSAAFVIRNAKNLKNYQGHYVQLTNYSGEAEKESHFRDEKNQYTSKQTVYERIAGTPVAYWCSNTIVKAFDEAKPLREIAEPRQGVKTLNNDLFLKLWYEVAFSNIGFGCSSIEESVQSKKKWFPYNKGGSYRKWYGNNEYLVNWFDDGRDMKKLAVEKYHSVTRTITNIPYFFKPGLTWSSLSSGNISLRAFDEGFIFDSKGSSMFFSDEKLKFYTLALINSKISMKFLEFLAPTLDFNIGPLSKIPVRIDESKFEIIDELVKENIQIAKEDWDAFETSWDFAKHPLIREVGTIEQAFSLWKDECENRYRRLKNNEEELNRIFIDIYGLQNEVVPEVGDDEVTVNHADLERDIKSLISYAVGCMFGRYSIYEDGLMVSGGEFEISDLKKRIDLESIDPTKTFYPDMDNIIPICEDEYFEEDIVDYFIKFIKCVYGEDTLETNLKYIADAIGGKGQSREVIRNYFLSSFYSDHCRQYQKRPIYWLFDSGKKNGFKALIYMNRYHADTLARIRTDYVHEQQSRYRTALDDLAKRLESSTTGDRVKVSKAIARIQDQESELSIYEEKIHHLADQMIEIDLDDGVKVNYPKFGDILSKLK